jgi:hypothetical protein
MPGRQRERASVTGLESIGLAFRAASPHRAYGVDDVLRREPVAARNSRLACRAAAEAPAFAEKRRARCAVNGTVDPATAEQRGIRGIDYRVNGERRNVRTNRAQCRVMHGRDTDQSPASSRRMMLQWSSAS